MLKEDLVLPWINLKRRNILATRTLEIAVFYFQVMSLILYIMFAKLFKWFKKKREGDKIEKSDPYIATLLRDNEDFIATENYFMTF